MSRCANIVGQLAALPVRGFRRLLIARAESPVLATPPVLTNTVAYGQETRRLLFVVAAGCSLLLLLLMAVPMMFGRVYVADDLGQFHLPARAFYAGCLAEGHAFDWWPQLYNGMYLTGEGQAGTYHPLHLSLYRLFPLWLAFDLEVWLNYPFMLLGMFLWLRRRLVRADVAMFGAMAFTFSGFNLLHFVHVNAIAVVAHIPWLLWAVDRAIDRRSHLASSLAIIAVLTASQILLGYPQYVWFSLIAEVSYLLWRTRSPGILVAFAAAKLIAVVIGAVQWLPTFESLQGSVREIAGASFFNNGSLHPLNLVQLLAPYLYETRVVGQNTHELGLYVGGVPLLLCCWLLLRGTSSRRHKPVVHFCYLLAPLALLLAMGSYAYVYHLQTWLPVVGSFRFPCRTIVLFHLAMAVLAAIGLDQIIRNPAGTGISLYQSAATSSAMLWWIVAASVVLAAAAPLLWWDHVAHWPFVVAGPLLLTCAAWLIRQAERGVTWAVIGLIVLTAVDQGIYGLSYAVLSRTAPLDTFANDPAIRPAGEAGDRVALDVDSALRVGTRTGNQLLLAGWTRVGGYVGLPPRRTLDYRQPSALRAAAVQWTSRQHNDPPRSSFERVEDAVPAIRLVSECVYSTTPAEDLKDIDIATTALVDVRLNLSGGEAGEVVLLENNPGHVSLLTNTHGRQLLVVAQSFHSGWHAFVDGRPAPVRRVNGDFVGCDVSEGEHHVELLFRPISLKKGTTLSWCGLGLLVCGFIATRQRKRPQQEAKKQ